ncbi:MAG: ATP synthase F0 subunit C [Bacteroidales bacterium]|nr:ATP synthase F0 subunit C [Bacteroidales bacterium]MBO4566478.1 ATP synthase F0 subunit C [Bacteroidales bacterium]
MIGTLLQAAVLAKVGGAIGAGIVAIAAAIGIGKLAQSTMEASARQPEIAGGMRTTAIIIGALIEGVCLFAVIVCLLAVLLK